MFLFYQLINYFLFFKSGVEITNGYWQKPTEQMF